MNIRLSLGNLPSSILTIGLLLASQSALAAVPVAVPPSADPTRADERFHIQERPPVENDSIITLPEQKAPANATKNDVKFTLKAVHIENLTAFTQEQLQDIYTPYIGQQVTLKTLNEVASKITARYRNAGYILSRAVVPPQRVADGIVTIRIVEGYVNKVSFEGLPVKDDLLTAYADKIRNAKPLDAKTLERYLLLMEDLPGLTARAVIQPSANTPGASDVIITLKQKSFDGGLTFDNRGSRFLGPYQAGITLNANNMLGLYDRTQFHGIISPFEPNELQFGEIEHEEQIGSEGTKIALAASFTKTEPGSKLENFDIVGEDRFYSVTVSHPFIRSRQSNLYGQVSVDSRDANVDIVGSNLYQDNIKAVRAGGSYDFVDSWQAVNRIETTLAKGIGWDDDASNFIRSRANGDPTFFKASFLASRLQPIEGPFNLYVTAAGQWALNPLLTAEQFGLGGPTFGSAYDPSEIVGDDGLAGRAELQYSRSGDFAYIPSYQLYAFSDYGKVWTREALLGTQSSDSLASAGVGTRFNLLYDVSGSLELAVPLTKRVAALGQDGGDPRVFFSLAYRY